jgi:hypothetical protein
MALDMFPFTIEGIAAKTLQILKIRIPSDVLKLSQQNKPAETDFDAGGENRLVSNT